MAQASVAHEFHKIRDEWASIEKQNWKMLIWVCEYPDIDIVDKFMQIEESPIGVFKDIFFRFDILFTTPEDFEKKLWIEFLSWFDPIEDPAYDIVGALKRERLLDNDYLPDLEQAYTSENLWKEFSRFRQAMKLEKENFIIYFPIGIHQRGLASWFNNQMIHEIPPYIRLVSMDIVQERKLASVKTKGYNKVIEVAPKLNMVEAIKNEINKLEKNSANTAEVQVNKQIRIVLETATKNKESLLETEVKKLLAMVNKIKNINLSATSFFIAANSYFTIKKCTKSLSYIAKALALSDELQKKDPQQSYYLWRSAIILKAASLLGIKDKELALETYQELVDRALKEKDVYYLMEGYRQIASIHYSMKQLDKTWENALLSIQSGSYLDLDMRRQSTYLISADMAYKAGGEIKSKEDMQRLALCLNECIGKDWKKLIRKSNFQYEY